MRGDPGSTHDRVEPGVHPRSPVSRRRFVRHLLSLGRQLPGIKAYAPRNPPFPRLVAESARSRTVRSGTARNPGGWSHSMSTRTRCAWKSGLHPCENFGRMTDDRFSRRQVLAGGLGAAAAFGISKSKLLGVTADPATLPAPAPGHDPAVPGAPLALTVDGLVVAHRAGTLRRGVRVARERPAPRRGAERLPDRRDARRTVPGSGTAVGCGRAADAFVAYGGRRSRRTPSTGGRCRRGTASGQPSPLSSPATFETGLGDPTGARTGSAGPRAEDPSPTSTRTRARSSCWRSSPIVRARVYVSGDQQYELYVNGTRAGKGEAYSYPDSQYYETLDVTRLLRPGAPNAVGLLYSWDGPTKGHPAGAAGRDRADLGAAPGRPQSRRS